MQLAEIAVWPRPASRPRNPRSRGRRRWSHVRARREDVRPITRPCRTRRRPAPSSAAVNHGSTFLESFRCNTSAIVDGSISSVSR
jgi:hypothetical protein